MVVATKWLPILKPASDIARTIGERIECLAPYPIDLFQVHIPWSRSPVKAQMHEMAELVRAGKVRAVGVSNFSASRMAKAGAALEAEGLPLASNQVHINLLDRSIESNGVLEVARRHGVTLIAYSPLGQGVLTGRFHDDPTRVKALKWGRRSRLTPTSRFLTEEGLKRSAPLIDGASRRRRGARRHARPGRPGVAGHVLRRHGRRDPRRLPARARDGGGGSHGPAADRGRDAAHRPSVGRRRREVSLRWR